jgi:hypothetical protein
VSFLTGDLRLGGKRSRQMDDHVEVVVVKIFDLVDQIPLPPDC